MMDTVRVKFRCNSVTEYYHRERGVLYRYEFTAVQTRVQPSGTITLDGAVLDNLFQVGKEYSVDFIAAKPVPVQPV